MALQSDPSVEFISWFLSKSQEMLAKHDICVVGQYYDYVQEEMGYKIEWHNDQPLPGFKGRVAALSYADRDGKLKDRTGITLSLFLPETQEEQIYLVAYIREGETIKEVGELMGEIASTYLIHGKGEELLNVLGSAGYAPGTKLPDYLPDAVVWKKRYA